MNKIKIILFYLLISAIIPATLLTILSFIGIYSIIATYKFEDLPILVSILLGVFGYFGLIILLFPSSKKSLIINLFLLISGVFGFILFNNITGGSSSWEWILTFQEPTEWFIYVWLNIVAILYIVILLKKINNNQQKTNTFHY